MRSTQFGGNSNGDRDPVVILVDNKTRDLDVAALIAHQIERFGVPCYLEPLEAFRAVLGAYRPGMIVFNHLNAAHLASWSKRLTDVGVLVGVLPNEGLVYNKWKRPLVSGRFHNAHVDHFFCWNQQHREALLAEGAGARMQIHVTGVPRFDFYFEPWAGSMHLASRPKSGRPQILFCTNFFMAQFHGRSIDLKSLFGGIQRYIPAEGDFAGAIESHWRSRNRIFEFINAIVDDGRFELVLRPHPNEDHSFYRNRLSEMEPRRRASIHFSPAGSITPLILDCDLQISCEICTTAVESWIARKPTIQLVFDKHSLLYSEEQAALNYVCADPTALPELIAQQLAAPEQTEKRVGREQHLEMWCAAPDGLSARRIAQTIVEAVRKKSQASWENLNANDYRRAVRLKMMRRLGLAYHFDSLLWLKRSLLPSRYAGRARAQQKTILPRDVIRARERLERVSV
jgi:surface carbohydrate biosynthesis protein